MGNISLILPEAKVGPRPRYKLQRYPTSASGVYLPSIPSMIYSTGCQPECANK